MKPALTTVRAGLCALVLVCAGNLPARAADDLVIAGEVKRPLTLAAAALRELPSGAQTSYRSSREISGQAPSATEVRGVRLLALLEQAGLAEGSRLDWRKAVVVAVARDGYRVVFSWPELANTAGGAQVMVAYERDGAPLAAEEGPLAIHAPADVRSGPRHVKWLQRLEVRILRD
jgi:DMSO/TMAO reductase YedYZ molybdopterin-dependent catalytic subunit